MKGGKSPLKLKAQHKGYTIIEVMIVLAVSGLMFLMAATFINGKQQKTAFTQGSNELGSRIQKVVDDVTNGHYSDVPLSCTASSANSDDQAAVSLDTGDSQGTNAGCVFLGKLVHFYGDPTTNYETISMADNRKATDDSFPRPSISRIQDLTSVSNIPQGLRLKSMTVAGVAGGVPDPNAYSIGFIQGSGSLANANTGEYRSGSQTVRLVFSSLTNKNTEVTDNSPFGTQVLPARSAKLCLTDDKHYAQVLIGDQAQDTSQLSIRVKQLGETPC